MTFSAQKIKQHVDNIRELCDRMNREYRQYEWKDVVYESFSQYIDICVRNIGEAERAAEDCEEKCKKLNGLNIESKMETAEAKIVKAKKVAAEATQLCG